MAKKRCPGSLRHSVAIQKPKADATPDDFGVVDMTDDGNWTTVASRRAAVEPRSGSEFFHGNQVQAEITHLVTLRQDSLTEQIGPRWRLKYGSRVLQVERAYSLQERGQWIECQCREMV